VAREGGVVDLDALPLEGLAGVGAVLLASPVSVGKQVDLGAGLRDALRPLLMEAATGKANHRILRAEGGEQAGRVKLPLGDDQEARLVGMVDPA
jgi:hypothetical protein